MLKIKALLRFVFGFSSTESNAFLILLPLMLIVIVSEPVYQTYFMSKKPDDLRGRKEIDSLLAVWEAPKENLTKRRKKTSDSTRRSYDSAHRLPYKKITRARPKVQREKFDLNLADTTELKTIYGIGPVIARRILTYRTNLGGFIHFNQLYEVWGLDSTVVVRLTEKTVIAPGFMPNKLAINRNSEQELARHPYLRTKLARAIVNYRLQHGHFTSLEDLKKITIIEEKVFLRIEPYITLD